jgi:hypothetical protein
MKPESEFKFNPILKFLYYYMQGQITVRVKRPNPLVFMVHGACPMSSLAFAYNSVYNPDEIHIDHTRTGGMGDTPYLF